MNDRRRNIEVIKRTKSRLAIAPFKKKEFSGQFVTIVFPTSSKKFPTHSHKKKAMIITS